AASSKVIFLPGPANQAVQSQLAQADAVGEGPSKYGASSAAMEYSQEDPGFQSAINSHVIENM
ncbi:hypothetical protein BDV96DRAFT_508112, partial [Lophiotrema nucula]